MTDQKPSRGRRRVIVLSLLWAGVMLLATYLLRTSEYRDYMFLLILAIGASTFLMTSRMNRCERSLYHRLFRKGEK